MLEQLILDMYAVDMIKFGEFTLKSGKKSYVYADIRTAISHPKIFTTLCDLIYSKMHGLRYDSICGVPYSALTFASGIAYAHQIPMLLKRKEAKEYGTKKILEGNYQSGDTCLVIEDVVTTGMSIGETTLVLEEAGLKVQDIVCFINRNQGGQERLTKQGYTLHSIIDLYQVLEILLKHGKISAADKAQAEALIGA
ncbi:MAG: orotate phosphoribosyltransferase [Burkholderiales bacterium]|jgi:uridine monophosphate synthetase|nr:orotate phosphoribosyltransferase [Burkholderiales bacterium]